MDMFLTSLRNVACGTRMVAMVGILVWCFRIQAVEQVVTVPDPVWSVTTTFFQALHQEDVGKLKESCGDDLLKVLMEGGSLYSYRAGMNLVAAKYKVVPMGQMDATQSGQYTDYLFRIDSDGVRSVVLHLTFKRAADDKQHVAGLIILP